LSAVRRIPFLCIDARWQARWKWLWGAFAAENETYLGYIANWDSASWRKVKFDDGILRDYNFAAPAQYLPTYAGESLGSVRDLGEMLEDDGVVEQTIEAQYIHVESPRAVRVGDLLFRDFNRRNRACPIVYSRPMTYRFPSASSGNGSPVAEPVEAGHIADNAEQVFFAYASESCDGTAGLRGTISGNNRREFWADAIWFSRTFADVPSVPSAAKLVLYVIAAGSVPRIRINGTWHHISPLDYFPSYGDPYGYVYRGHKHIVGAIHELPLHELPLHELPLHLGAGESNEFVVEHIAPCGDDIGAQVIFAMEWETK